MTDELLNGTNRVVLDGVMTENECDRILLLAKVCYDRGGESHLALKVKRSHSVFCPVSQAAASAGDGYRGRRSPHTPHETLEGLSVLRAAKVR